MLGRYKIELYFIAAGLLLLSILFVEQFIASGASISYYGVPFDDVFIHCRYAQNLLSGNGYSFNPPVQLTADTSPLWVVLIAAGGLVTSHLEVVAALLSSVAWLLIAPGVYRLAKYALGIEERWAILAGALVLINPRLFVLASSGMETSLAALLTLIAVEIHLHSRNRGQIRIREAVILSLAIAVRPELYLLVAIALGDWIYYLSKQRLRLSLLTPYITIIIGGFVNVFSLPMLIEDRLSYHSSIVQGAHWRWIPDFYYVGRSFAILLISYLAIVIAINIFAVRSRVRMAWKSQYNFAIAFIILLPIAQAFFSPQYRHFGRYIFPLIPLVAITITLVLRHLCGKSPMLSQWRIIILCSLVTLVITMYSWTQIYYNAVSNITDQHVSIASWVKTNLSSSDVIAADDVGALAYFTNRSIIDLTGLVTPQLYPLQEDQRSVWTSSRAMGANVYIIYTRLNPTFYQYAADSLQLLKEFPVSGELVSSADTVMRIFRVKGNINAAR